MRFPTEWIAIDTQSPPQVFRIDPSTGSFAPLGALPLAAQIDAFLTFRSETYGRAYIVLGQTNLLELVTDPLIALPVAGSPLPPPSFLGQVGLANE